jgi:hypothetical protein
MVVKKERRAAPRKPASPPPAAQPKEIDKPITGSTTPPAEVPSPEDVRRRIEMNAYFKAKARGFAPGYELQDWLEAEREVRQRR